VVRALEAQGRGFSTAGGPVPIVPAAGVYDLVSSGGVRPGPDEGAAAYAAAQPGAAFATGRVGAGTGATVGKWRGADDRVPGGLGSASARVDDAVVGALAIVNAIGDVVGADGRVLAGSTAPPEAPPFPEPLPFEEGEHTTLVVVATSARLTKLECHLVAQTAHHAMSRTLYPSHTRFDGDIAFALATCNVGAHLDRLRVVTIDAVVDAIRNAVA
jgi:L-aminopeptidase/D-esterase-like protein